MQNKKIENVIITIIFIIVPFWLFKDGFSAGKILYGTDTIMLDFPFRIFAQKMFQQYHDLPLWMPYIFGGIPFIDSSMNYAYFYPLNLVYMITQVPPYHIYTVNIIFQMIISAFGIYLLLRQLEAAKESSLFGAFVFMTGSFFISLVYAGHSNIINATALMPYIFYFTGRGIKEKKLFHFLNASIFCALCVLCAGMQILAYTYIGVFLYILYELLFSSKQKDAERIKKTAIFFILSTGMIILFSALQFFQSTGYIPYSWRGNFTYEDFASWSFNPGETITFLFPDFFGLKDETYWGSLKFNLTTFYLGIIPVMLIPFAFTGEKSRKPAIFFSISAIIFFILGCGGFTPLYRILYYIPVFNAFRNPSRFLYVFDMFVIILSAFGINNIMLATQDKGYKGSFKSNKLLKLWLYTAAATGIIMLIICIFVFNTTGVSGFIKNTCSYTGKSIPTDTIIAENIKLLRGDVLYFFVITFTFLFTSYLWLIRKIKQPYIFLCLIAVFALTDLYRVDKKFIKYENIADYFNNNDQIMQRLQQDKEPARTADFGKLLSNKNIYYDVEFITGYHGLVPLKYYTMLKKSAFNIPDINRMYNIKYYISQSDINMNGLIKIFDGPVKIIEDKKAMPRAFILDKVYKVDNDGQELSIMMSDLFDPATVLTTENIPVSTGAEKLQYDLHFTEYTPNKIKIGLETNKAGVLVLSNSYYPSWRVKVDGRLEKIYNVDYMIMGVPVEKGTHEIEFYYDNTKILLSLVLTIIGILIYIFVYFIEIRRKQQYKEKQLKGKKCIGKFALTLHGHIL